MNPDYCAAAEYHQKPQLLQLAEDLGIVSKAMHDHGYPRETFHEVRRVFQVVGTLLEESR